MVQVCALASGSNGNCYYIGNNDEAILVDIGISNLQLVKRLKEAELPLNKIKAILISHEHSDHIKGLRVACDKNNISAYLTRKTWENIKDEHKPRSFTLFEAGNTIHIGNIKIHSFRKQHDAIDPVSFRVEIDGTNVAVLTDLGIADTHIKEHLVQCDVAFLESNYEPEILENGGYPYYLKRRVASDIGHLSNQQAFELVNSLNSSRLKTIFLSHISENNNKLDIAMETFKPLESKISIEPTSRETIAKVLEL